MYVRESFAPHMIPVFTYYQMLQSEPSVGGDEQARDLSNMRNPATMRAYWADYSLLLRRRVPRRRVTARGDPRRARSVGVSGAGPRHGSRARSPSA